MSPVEERRRLSKNIFTKAIAKNLDRALRSSFHRKIAPKTFDSLGEEESTRHATALFESDDALKSRAGKFCRSDSCSTVESTSDLHVHSEESLPSLPGSVESDDEENETLYKDACYDQPKLKRIGELVRQVPCENGQVCSPAQSEETQSSMDDEFRQEKDVFKALVRSFAKEANSGLKCRIFEDQSCTYVPAKLFLDRSLTLILVHDGDKISIPLVNIVAAYSSGDLKECCPDSKQLNDVNNGRGGEVPGTAAFIQHRAPGFPESLVSVSFADEESKERCILSINVLQKLAEMRQQRSVEHRASFA